MRLKFLEQKPSVDLSLSYTYPLRDDDFQTKCLKRKVKEEHSTFLINYVILPTNGSGLFPAHSSLVSCLPFSYFILVVISRHNTLSLGLISLFLNYYNSLFGILPHSAIPFF